MIDREHRIGRLEEVRIRPARDTGGKSGDLVELSAGRVTEGRPLGLAELRPVGLDRAELEELAEVCLDALGLPFVDPGRRA
jgi:hypothetical protein